MKLTGWYQGDQKPVYVGVFEKLHPSDMSAFSYWDGARWNCMRATIYGAVFYKNYQSQDQTLPWRGVKIKSTGWYLGDQRPVRFGYYERKSNFSPTGKIMCWWNGIVWKPEKDSKDVMMFQHRPWRGVAK